MMNNNYDVMDDMHQTSEKRLSNQEYANMKKEERKQLSNMTNDQALAVATNPKTFLVYLGMQARLGYTVNNTLLVMNQFPNAKLVKDYDAWKKDDTYVKRNPVSIKILDQVMSSKDAMEALEEIMLLRKCLMFLKHQRQMNRLNIQDMMFNPQLKL